MHHKIIGTRPSKSVRHLMYKAHNKNESFSINIRTNEVVHQFTKKPFNYDCFELD